MASPKLDLADCPRVRVFRALVAIVKTDATLRRFVPVDNWHVWDGRPLGELPPASNRRAQVILTPVGEPTEWYSPDSIAETLTVWVDLEVASENSDDLENLWYSFVRALYPRDNPSLAPQNQARITIADGLRAVGARTGVCRFKSPGAFDPEALAKDGVLSSRASVQIDVIDSLDV